MFEIQAVLLVCDRPEKLEGFQESLGAVIAMSTSSLQVGRKSFIPTNRTGRSLSSRDCVPKGKLWKRKKTRLCFII